MCFDAFFHHKARAVVLVKSTTINPRPLKLPYLEKGSTKWLDMKVCEREFTCCPSLEQGYDNNYLAWKDIGQVQAFSCRAYLKEELLNFLLQLGNGPFYLLCWKSHRNPSGEIYDGCVRGLPYFSVKFHQFSGNLTLFTKHNKMPIKSPFYHVIEIGCERLWTFLKASVVCVGNFWVFQYPNC